MFNKDLAYWIGVVQSDGCFKTYFDKNKKNLKYLISFCIGKRSLPMLNKFSSLSSSLFNRNATIFKMNNYESWNFHISVKELLEDFRRLDISFGDPPKPPGWSLNDNVCFGAYLAGLIDGDGDIRIKRKKYPQCVIRISSGHKQFELENSIEKIMLCSASITKRKSISKINERIIIGESYNLEFYLSKKNLEFIKEFVVPHIAINHKREKLQSYIKSRCPE